MTKLYRESDRKEFKFVTRAHWSKVRSKEGNDTDLVKYIGRSRYRSIDSATTYKEESR